MSQPQNSFVSGALAMQMRADAEALEMAKGQIAELHRLMAMREDCVLALIQNLGGRTAIGAAPDDFRARGALKVSTVFDPRLQRLAMCAVDRVTGEVWEPPMVAENHFLPEDYRPQAKGMEA